MIFPIDPRCGIKASETLSELKSVELTGTTAGLAIWTPPAGLHVDIRSILFSFQTGSTSDDAVATIQYKSGGAWKTLTRLGAKKDKLGVITHTFVSHVDTDDGDGVNPVIQLVVTGTDTDMVTSVTIEGSED